MDTLTTARRKSIEIALSVASMNHIHNIIPAVDELLEILIGEKVFTNVPHFQRNPTPPPPPPPTTVILSHLEKTKTSMTIRRICQETGLDTKTTQVAIDKLLAESKITSPKMRGRKQYACIEYAHLL